MAGYLDQLKMEWRMAAADMIHTFEEFGDEFSADFHGYGTTEQERKDMFEKRKATAQRMMPREGGLGRSFIDGVYAAKNQCKAQGMHGSGRTLGSAFNFGSGTSHGGPAGPGYC